MESTGVLRRVQGEISRFARDASVAKRPPFLGKEGEKQGGARFNQTL
jgi:hypothetical protein